MTPKPMISVLGGSTPFTAAFFDAIASSHHSLQPHRLMLFGRDSTALDVVTRRAQHCLGPLGWSATATTNLTEALEGASFVVHQIRYGDLDEREAGERLAERFGTAADETLGPAALHWAIGHASSVRETARHIASRCSNAWILNLSNPLSITTALFIREGVTRCLGVCELPETTAHGIAQMLSIADRRLEWQYIGLNHRGFLYNLSADGRPLHAAILSALPSATLPGITRDDVSTLRAVPLKYFQMLRAPKPTARRASVLRDLRVSLLRELAADPTRSPPSLGERNLDWYAKGVVPLLAALAADGGTRVVNLMGRDDVVIETKAEVGADFVAPLQTPRPPPAVEWWIARFLAHERAMLEATITTSPLTIANALELDPLVRPEQVAMLTRELLRTWHINQRRDCSLYAT
jgi:6-phospho-beta-glucosidase